MKSLLRAVGRKRDMTQAEKYSWASLITTGAIYWFFQMRMLDGWQVVEQSPGRLAGVYIAVVILSIIAEAVIAGATAAHNKDGGIEKDERDFSIEAKANQNVAIFFAAAINILIIQVLADAAYPANVLPKFMPQLVMDTPAEIFFILFTLLYAAHFVKLISTIILYRK